MRKRERIRRNGNRNRPHTRSTAHVTKASVSKNVTSIPNCETFTVCANIALYGYRDNIYTSAIKIELTLVLYQGL
jgi:hypothetical protein